MKKILSLVVFVLLLVLAGCSKNKITDKKLVIGASPAPHAEILELARDYIEAKGYTLEIVEFTDYVLPNRSLESGELDANFFQHVPYLNQYNEENETNLVPVFQVHFEPLGVYRGTGTTLEAITDGAKIAIPNDTTNCARALQLIASTGLITIDESKGLLATENDIITNLQNIEFTALEAASIPAQLSNFDFAVINGNYAVGSNILDKLVTNESAQSLAAETYANVIVVNAGNENADAIKVLIEALQQDIIAEFINDTYDGLVLPIND